MQRGRMLAGLATGTFEKNNAACGNGMHMKHHVRKKVGRSSYPDYVQMYDQGKWDELQEYLRFNKKRSEKDICTRVFNKPATGERSVDLIKDIVLEGIVGKVMEGMDNNEKSENSVIEEISGPNGRETVNCVLKDVDSAENSNHLVIKVNNNWEETNFVVEDVGSGERFNQIVEVVEGVDRTEKSENSLIEKITNVGEIVSCVLQEMACEENSKDIVVEGNQIGEGMDVVTEDVGYGETCNKIVQEVAITERVQGKQNTVEDMCNGRTVAKDKVGEGSSCMVFSLSPTGELVLEDNLCNEAFEIGTSSLHFEMEISSRKELFQSFDSTSEMDNMSDPLNLGCEYMNVSNESTKTNKSGLHENSTSSKPIRRWDRKNFCIYCRKLITNFSRHVLKFHQMEKEVIEYNSILDSDLKLRKRKRQAITDELRKRGNFIFNSTRSDYTEILPTRRPSKNIKRLKTSLDYLTCQHCLGMFSRKTFFKHRNKCSSIKTPTIFDETETSKSIGQIVFGCKERQGTKSDGIQIIPNVGGASKLLVDRIFPILNKDEFGLIAVNDPLILSIGSHFLCSHQEKKDEYSITKKMRDSAKLLKLCREDPEIVNFEDVFKPSKFDIVMKSVQELSGLDSETGTVKVVGMPARLAYVIQEGAKILTCEVIKNNSLSSFMKEKMKNEISDFIQLYKHKWKFLVSSNAEKTRKKLSSIKTRIIPDDNDIKIIAGKIRELELEYYRKLSKEISPENYENLCKITIAHVIILNRRRSGEVARAELQYYVNRPPADDLTEDVLATLTQEERETLPKLTVFMIPGKLVHSVPVLLTSQMKASIDLIISSRIALRIPKHNNLLFARTATMKPLDACKILRDLRTSCKLKKESFMTATGLRHHMATKSQVHGSEQYTENVCQFLGHTKNIHKQNYRIPLQAIQRGQIGCRLLQMEDDFTAASSKKGDFYGSEDIENFPNSKQGRNDSDEEFNPSESEKTKKIKRSIVSRRRWSDEEKNIVLKTLGTYITEKKNPGMKVSLELISKNPILAGRTWAQVNALINNFNTGKAKLPKSFQHLITSSLN